MVARGSSAAAILFFTIILSGSAAGIHVVPGPARFPFSIAFDTAPGMYYDVQGSTNLFSWEILKTLRAPSATATWTDTNSDLLALRYYRIEDLSGTIVVEGDVTSPDGQGVPQNCPFCDILVSSSLTGATTYTDRDGHYALRTGAAAASTNLPFTIYFSKLGFRAYSALVTNTADVRVEVMTLAGPSNNDFTNRLVIAGSGTNRANNADADVEPGEPGPEPSVWFSFTAPADGTLRFVVDTTDFLPVIGLFKGDTLATLQPVERGAVSNWIEWRIEITRDLAVYAGEQFQIRVGAGEHPTRGIAGGDYEWRCVFEPDFPLQVDVSDANEGGAAISAAPNANGRYAPGSIVTIQAAPAPNYIFAGWSGSVTSSEAAITLVMNEAKELMPHFQLANGNYSNATLLAGEAPSATAWVPEDGVVWYS